MMPTLVILGGMSRSGTTLLMKLLNTHPDIGISNELRNFLYLNKSNYWRFLRPRFWRHSYMLGHGARASRLFLIRYLLYSFPFIWNGFSEEDLRRVLHWIWPEKHFVGDKFPRYLFNLRRFRHIPNKRIIIIYRDCRDVTASFLKRFAKDWSDKKWAENMSSVSAIAARWVKAIEQMEKHKNDIFCLRYEDLVAQPSTSIEKMAEYLGVEAKDFRLDIIRDSSVGKYKEALTEEQIAEIEAVAGATMRRIGYEI